MQKIQLGKSKVKITKLGMGTWAIGGGPAWGDEFAAVRWKESE